ncbi:MAG: adenylate/guanylate cyclase domain-containing protein [Proteobacteria bacterium]|nr:adenylate/guanylate cyclase domain-containing protein [Pseudomonadota bacterium]
MAEKRVERRLAAILAADVVGYSRLMGEDEEATLRTLKAYRELIDGLIANHRGRVFGSAGDSVIAEFASPVEAVRCAIEIQKTLEERNVALAEDRRMRFRIGVNLGDVMIEGDNLYGDGVNVAARLEGLAEPGGICVSGIVQQSVEAKADCAFHDLGDQEVKNIAKPVRVYRVRNEPAVAASLAPGGATGEPAVPLALPDKPSIAILPFANMSGDPEQEYFSDGITEDIITALSNVRSFFVIARHSSFTYKGRAVDVKDVGRELGVHYVLEGSVRKAGNRVRVTAQLVEAASGNHIWADRYDGALDDIFDLQDQISASVVGAIEPQLHRAEVERIRHKRPESFDAYDLTLSGLAKMNKLNPRDTADALTLFLEAIELDANYARAYVYASYCHRRQVQLKGMVLSEEDKASSIRLARAALRADRTDPNVLWQAAMTVALIEKDYEEAAALVDRSLAINANANRAWIASGMLRCCVGDPETAIEHAERAMRLSPLDISMWVAEGVMATAWMQLGNYEEALAWARKSARRHPDNLPAHHVLAASAAQLGRRQEAEAAVRDVLERDPALTIARLKEIYPVAGYKNLEGFIDGLRKAGLPE